MKPIKEKSAEYARKIWAGGKRPFASAKKMSEQDFTAGAEWMRGELTRWNDPKQELPETNVSVLIKATDQLDNEAIYLGSREGTEFMTDGGAVIGIDFGEETTPDMNVKVIGWREIF